MQCLILKSVSKLPTNTPDTEKNLIFCTYQLDYKIVSNK
jgi:hypothetical protein